MYEKTVLLPNHLTIPFSEETQKSNYFDLKKYLTPNLYSSYIQHKLHEKKTTKKHSRGATLKKEDENRLQTFGIPLDK